MEFLRRGYITDLYDVLIPINMFFIGFLIGVLVTVVTVMLSIVYYVTHGDYY